MHKLACILAGGAGVRLWPISTKSNPKQFIKFEDEPLIYSTIKRISKLFDKEEIFIFCQREIFTKVKKLPVFEKNIIIEDYSKNTAPPVALISSYFKDKDPILGIFPSDHWIVKEEEFIKAINRGIDFASSGYIVTFGILPKRVEVGYGYIKPSMLLSKKDNIFVYKVKEFKEKPNFNLAKKLIKEGYLWNSGIFLFKASCILEELKRSNQKLFEYSRNVDIFNKKQLRSFYKRVEAISIDYAVMEKSDKIVVIKAPFYWEDLGNWENIFSSFKQNNIFKRGECITVDSEDCLVWAEEGKILTFGIKNMVVIRTKEVTLVMSKDKAAQLKDVVESLPASWRE